MANNSNMIPIPGRLHSVATDGQVAGANEIYDDAQNKNQSTINSELINAVGTGGSVDSRIAAAVNEEKTRAEAAEAALDGRVDTLETAVGSGGSVDSRISSAVNAAKSEIKGNATSACDTLGEAEALISAEATRAQAAEENLRQLYNNLQQSQPIPVTSLPVTGEAGKIYRLAGETSYADYMWDGTQFVKMAEYDNAIDDEPTADSDNLVKSGGVQSKLGGRLNLLGLPYYTIPKSINISDGHIDDFYADCLTLVCPIDESKSYMYYSGVSGGGSGAMRGFYDENFNVLSFARVDAVGWVDLGTIPTGAKYFCACIKFVNYLSEEGAKQCCFVEKNQWFKYLENLSLTVQQNFSNNGAILYNQSTERISRSLFENAFTYVNKLGITERYYNGFMYNNGAYNQTGNAGDKTLVAKVVAGKKYKLYVSKNNNAGNDVGCYSFFDSANINDNAHIISSSYPTPKGQWLTITAPNNAQYFAMTMEIGGNGDYTDCCFVEYNKWFEYLETDNVASLKDFDDSIKPAFEFVSKNLFDSSKIEKGYVSDNGDFAVEGSEGQYVSSGLIPVKPNTIYYISGRTIDNVPSICTYDENGNYYKVLRPDGTTYGSYAYIYSANNNKIPNGPFKTPAEAKYLRFTLRFNYLPADDYTNVMLEEIGQYYDYKFTPSPYQPYKLNPFISSNSLPESVSILKGKKIVYNGDSICASRLGNIQANNGGSYPLLISQATGCTFENRGLDGGTLVDTGADNISSRNIVTDIQNMAADADLVCFEGGINDWSSNKQLGTYTQGDFTSAYDETTICGALESIFRQALNKWVGKPIVFVICHKVNSAASHKESGTFYEVHDKIVEICHKWGIPYYDAFQDSPLNGSIDVINNAYINGGSVHPDGWHPDRGGYIRYYVPQLIKLFESLMPVNN